jgi:hypothetical protein
MSRSYRSRPKLRQKFVGVFCRPREANSPMTPPIGQQASAIPATLPRPPPHPLAVALPRVLEKIEVDLATAGPAERCRFRQRAELIRELLAPRPADPLPT